MIEITRRQFLLAAPIAAALPLALPKAAEAFLLISGAAGGNAAYAVAGSGAHSIFVKHQNTGVILPGAFLS